MYHVRFLKVPYTKTSKISIFKRFESKSNRSAEQITLARSPISRPPANGGYIIHAVVTVTTDLGESFLYGDAQLSVTFLSISKDGKESIVSHQIVDWTCGMQALPIELPVTISDIRRIKKQNAAADEFIIKVDLNQGVRYVDHNHGDAENNDPIRFLPVTSQKFEIRDGFVRYKRDDNGFVVRKVELGNLRLALLEETGNSVNKHLWDSGLLLANYISTSSAAIQKKILSSLIPSIASGKIVRILELGTGCGLVGILFSKLVPNSEVYLSDLESTRDVCERNIALNKDRHGRHGKMRFVTFDWDSSSNTASENAEVYDKDWDLVISCDCTYNPDSFGILTDVMQKVIGQTTKLLLVHKDRHGSEKQIFDMLRDKTKFVCDSEVVLGKKMGISRAHILSKN
ncbi:putative methyltransferase-domain-containing protein [Lipomyces japonicus]|uniref:putative methyltransferase-domain-containing protein n=1 Tax=Lipomyces japonicus TaxID=56871 RepID=UPI0034CFE4E2